MAAACFLPLLATSFFFAGFLLLLAQASEGAACFLPFLVAVFLAGDLLLLPLPLLCCCRWNSHYCLYYYRRRRYTAWLVVFVPLVLCLHNCFCFSISNFRILLLGCTAPHGAQCKAIFCQIHHIVPFRCTRV